MTILYIHNIQITYDIYIAWHLAVIKRILLHVTVSSVNLRSNTETLLNESLTKQRYVCNELQDDLKSQSVSIDRLFG